VVVGTTSAAKTVTLTNSQQVALSITNIVAGGPFAVVNNTCGSSLAAGTSCTVGVTFAPATLASVNGTLTFTDNAANSPQKVSLMGTGASSSGGGDN
jgi:hypothetical protein